MRVYEYEHTIHFDVDDTLIMWDDDFRTPTEISVKVVCPHTQEVSYHRPHERHLRFLKKQLAKGVGVVIWSAGGFAWAKAAAEALELQDLDILVISKPQKCIDDLSNASDILPVILYLDEKGHSS